MKDKVLKCPEGKEVISVLSFPSWSHCAGGYSGIPGLVPGGPQSWPAGLQSLGGVSMHFSAAQEALGFETIRINPSTQAPSL